MPHANGYDGGGCDPPYTVVLMVLLRVKSLPVLSLQGCLLQFARIHQIWLLHAQG